MVFEVLSFDGSHRKRKGMGQEGGGYVGYHTQQGLATKCGGWVMRGWGMLESVRNNLGQQNVGDGFRRGWGTMDRARNNLAGQNEGDGGGGGGVRWIVYATSSRKITRVMGQQGVGYDG